MKIKFILFLTLLMGTNYLFGQSKDEYLKFLEQQNLTAKEYILSLFKTKDIVIFTEGHHAEMEQYNLLLDVIKDPYFIKNVGAVYIEVSNITHSPVINSFLLHEGYDSIQAYQKTTELYQLGNNYHLWNCHSYPWLIYNLYTLNQGLKKEEKIQLYGCDLDFDWKNCKTKQEYDTFELDPANEPRDSIMAANFIKQYTQVQRSRNGKKKALVIMNSRHGFLKDTYSMSTSSMYNNTGRYLHDKFQDRIASVFMMCPGHPNSMEEYTVIKEGKWDAYFELSGKTDIGFNLHNTPFGLSEFDSRPVGWNIFSHSYQDIHTGLVFYKTMEQHVIKRGWENAVTDDFKPELIRRMKCMDFDDTEIEQELKIENTVRTELYPGLDTMRKKIDTWKDNFQ